MSRSSKRERVELLRGLGAWDATLLVIGSVLGGGIFITTGDMARVLPHEGLILLVWLGGGAMTLAGALTYAELGVIFPRAGGIYHFLKEAYGPVWGFLYGWGAFFAIMSGGIAAIAVGTAEYLGAFVPFATTTNVLATTTVAGATWTLSGGQVVAVALILALTAVNWLGLREGAAVQNVLTVVKVAAVVAFGAVAWLVPARATAALAAPLPAVGLLSAFGVAMVGALWTYDGWYGVTFTAGELRNPARDLPIGLIAGTLVCAALYALLNLFYFRALTIAEIAATPRVAETAATALLGATGGRLLATAVLISSLGCLAASILYSARIYLPMARDGLFFSALAAVHPRFRTPGPSLWLQGIWSALLALSGRYDQLYTYAIFVSVVFHVGTAAAVFVLRRKLPDTARPYRVRGYPLVPALFILAALALVANTLVERPAESLFGLALLALGLPAYAYWRRSSGRPD